MMRAVRRKIRQEMRISPEPGFPRMGPVHYLTYLQDLHLKLAPKVYLEIGTESGASLSFAECIAFAVDPAFNLQADVSRNKPELHQFQGTSDGFFGSRMIERLGYQVELAFLDGMHHFEYLLRDFINTERLMSRTGIITIHDCVPISYLSAERDWNREETTHWVGDVWKLLPILRQYRPDLKVEVLDLVPTGLVVVSGLDPASSMLSDSYQAIMKQYADLTLAEFGVEKLVPSFGLVSVLPQDAVQAEVVSDPILEGNKWIEPVTSAADPLSIAIKTSVRDRAENEIWGDFHFAKGLARGFLAKGHRVRIDAVPDWNSDGGKADVDLVLHGDKKWTPRTGVTNVEWVLYPGFQTPLNLTYLLRHADRALLSCGQLPENLALQNASSLLQGFDPELMFVDGTARSDDIVFVGNNHRRMTEGRPIIELAAAAGLKFRLWGKKWKNHPAYQFHEGDYLPNVELGHLYRRSRIVLCDHMPAMRDNGYISNRIFDALACGAAVICDTVVGLPDEFMPFVRLCGTVEELKMAVADILAEGLEKQEERRMFALSMRDRHSLHQRAASILEICRSIAAKPLRSDA